MYKKLIPVLVFALALCGCGSRVKIQSDTLRLSLGQEQALKISAPKGEKLSFSSMDPNIVSVDKDGVIKALGSGITVVTVKTDKSFDNVGVVVGTGVAQYVSENGIIVPALSAKPVDEALITGESDITGLAISLVGGGSEDVSITTDRTYEIKITKTPEDSADKVTLRITDPSVARIEGKTLIGVSRGKTTLIASSPNGITAEMIVRVK